LSDLVIFQNQSINIAQSQRIALTRSRTERWSLERYWRQLLKRFCYASKSYSVSPRRDYSKAVLMNRVNTRKSLLVIRLLLEVSEGSAILPPFNHSYGIHPTWVALGRAWMRSCQACLSPKLAHGVTTRIHSRHC